MEGHDVIEKTVDEAMYIPRIMPIVAPIFSVIPLQLYHTIFYRKRLDVDKPRNLANQLRLNRESLLDYSCTLKKSCQ